MCPKLYKIVVEISKLSKKNVTEPIKCCWCNNRTNIIKWGKYWRYNFNGTEMVFIQRYLCKNDSCPHRTFSILPHPFLRIKRFSLCMITLMIQMARQTSRSELARRFNLTWATVDRGIKKDSCIIDWIDQVEAPWSPSPCLNPIKWWSEFIKMFAMKFYPKRYDQHNLNIL